MGEFEEGSGFGGCGTGSKRAATPAQRSRTRGCKQQAGGGGAAGFYKGSEPAILLLPRGGAPAPQVAWQVGQVRQPLAGHSDLYRLLLPHTTTTPLSPTPPVTQQVGRWAGRAGGVGLPYGHIHCSRPHQLQRGQRCHASRHGCACGRRAKAHASSAAVGLGCGAVAADGRQDAGAVAHPLPHRAHHRHAALPRRRRIAGGVCHLIADHEGLRGRRGGSRVHRRSAERGGGGGEVAVTVVPGRPAVSERAACSWRAVGRVCSGRASSHSTASLLFSRRPDAHHQKPTISPTGTEVSTTSSPPAVTAGTLVAAPVPPAHEALPRAMTGGVVSAPAAPLPPPPLGGGGLAAAATEGQGFPGVRQTLQAAVQQDGVCGSARLRAAALCSAQSLDAPPSPAPTFARLTASLPGTQLPPLTQSCCRHRWPGRGARGRGRGLPPPPPAPRCPRCRPGRMQCT